MPTAFPATTSAIAASTEPHRHHSGGLPRPLRRPRADDAPENLGAVAASLSENNRERRRRTADLLLDKRARGYVPGEDCSHCGAALEKGDEGLCNTCHKPYDTGPLARRNKGRRKKADDYSAVMALFKGKGEDGPRIDGLLDVARKSDGSLFVNVGDWSDVGSKAIKAVAPAAEVGDEYDGNTIERHGWTRLFPKKADNAVGVPARMMRFYDPITDRRETLEGDEEAAVDKGQSQWFPQFIQTDSTKIPQMMAGSGRQGLLAGLAAGAGGAGLAHVLGASPAITAGAGLGAGALAGLSRYFSQHHENDRLLESMRRLPHGATKRDLDAEQRLGNAFEAKYGADISGNVGEKAAAPWGAALEEGEAAVKAAPKLWGGIKSMGSSVGSLFRGAPGPSTGGWAYPTLGAAAGKANYAPGAIQQGWNATANKVAPVAKAVSPYAQSGLGAYLGWNAAGDIGGVGDQQASPWTKALGAAAGASVGNPQLRARMMQSGVGQRYVNSMLGGVGGSYAGLAVDQTAGRLGYDTNHQFSQWGGRAGILGGLTSPRLGAAANNGGMAVISGSNPAFALPEVFDVARAATGTGQYAGQSIGQRLFGQGVRARRVGQGLAAASLGAGGVAYGAGKVRDNVLQQFGVDPQAFQASGELSNISKGLEIGDPSAIAKARQLDPRVGMKPDGQFDVNLARQQVGEMTSNAKARTLSGVADRLGVPDYVRSIQEQTKGQVQQTVRDTANAWVKEKFGSMGEFLQGGLQNVMHLADGVLGAILPGNMVSQMTTIQKILTIFGALGLIGGAVTGSGMTGLLGGAALAYGLGGGMGLFGGGQQPQPQQPQAQPGQSNRQPFTPAATQPTPTTQPATQPTTRPAVSAASQLGSLAGGSAYPYTA